MDNLSNKSSMINPPITDLIEKVDSKYTLVIEASKRARQIAEGQPPLTECSSLKPVSIACFEILQDKISYVRIKDGIK